MDLRSVAYFAAVAERGTLRGAAARLGISQPALTKAIRRLTLNILLNFAQFEREVIGERIRDKFAAS